MAAVAATAPAPETLSHSLSLDSTTSTTSSSSSTLDTPSDSSSSSNTTFNSSVTTTSVTSVTSSSDALAQRQQHYGPNIALSYSQPLLVERGEGCWLFEEGGRRYLDCVNNVAHVGHANPQVTAAIASQLGRVNTNSRYLSRELNTYCQELTDTLPEPLKVVYLGNSGSEANDLALRIASAAAAAAAATGSSADVSSSSSSSSSSSRVVRDHVVVMAGAYHGHLSSLIPLSPYKFWGPGGTGKPDWVHVMPAPDMYRGLNLDGAAAARACLAQAAASGGRVVAFFCESIISCGGQLLLPPGYLQAVYGVMRAAGVVCVADEVQTGFGRTGAMSAFEHQGVVPDIVTMGKPMGNGFPIAGVVTSPRLAAAFDTGMEYFNTYGGNNAAVAAGRAVLRELKEKNLQAHAAAIGRYMLAALQQVQADFPHLICDVRGQGLFVGLEFATTSGFAIPSECCAKDSQVTLSGPGSAQQAAAQDKTPAPLAAKALKEGCRARGVLLSSDGPVGHVVKVKPPMVFGEAEVNVMVAVMREVLVEMTQPPAWQQLMAAEQVHHTQHVAPILARYRHNEQQVWAAAAAAAAAAPQQQQGGEDATGLSSLLSSVLQTGPAAAAAAGAQSLSGSCASLSEADCSIVVLPGAADAGAAAVVVGGGGGADAAAAALKAPLSAA